MAGKESLDHEILPHPITRREYFPCTIDELEVNDLIQYSVHQKQGGQTERKKGGVVSVNAKEITIRDEYFIEETFPRNRISNVNRLYEAEIRPTARVLAAHTVE